MSISQNYGNIKPSLNLDFANVKKLDPRVTFSRASTARYYDGKSVAKAEENLLLYSQEFDNASWIKANATATANATTAPDGTLTADTLTASAGSGGHDVYQNNTLVSGSQYVMSVFAKKNTHDFIQLRHYNAVGGTTRYANFDLATGALGTVGADATASITDFGNGWYRCVMIATPTGTVGGMDLWIIPASTSGSAPVYTAAGTESIYIWGAQLEQRSQATAYQPTTSQPITNYIPVLQTAAANVARFDHDPVTGESLGLLVEEQRTNLFTYSEDFSDASWTKSNATVTSNTVVAPDGTLTMDKLVENTATSSHAIWQIETVTVGVAYTFSVYIKKAERSLCNIRFGGQTNSPHAIIDLTTGEKLSGSLSVVVMDVGNEVWRVSGTLTATQTTLACNIQAAINTTVDGINNSVYTGDGYSGIYIWGAQLESGQFSTSYIPTTSSQVTRSSDAASMTGTNFSEWYRQDEGTFYGEVIGYKIDTVIVGTINDGTSSNGILLDNNGTAGRLFVRRNAITEASITTSAITNSVKLVGAYKTNDCAATANGSVANTDLSVLLPLVDRLTIGRNTIGNFTGSQTIKKIAYYPVKLEPAQLQALTS